MAYDVSRNALLISLGEPIGRRYGDTWQFKDNHWRMLNDSGPSKRAVHQIAYDPLSKNVVPFGGHAEPQGKYLRIPGFAIASRGRRCGRPTLLRVDQDTP